MRPTSFSGWMVPAAAAGTTAALVGGITYGVGYHAYWAHLSVPWMTIGLSLFAYAIVTGALFGIAMCGGVVAASRLARRGTRGARGGAVVAAATVGGAIGGVLPGVVAVAGFGSLRMPYSGTGPIVAAFFLGLVVFVSLCALPRATGWDPERRLRRGPTVVALSFAAALFGIGSVAGLGLVALDLLGGLPTQSEIACLMTRLGPVPAGAAFGTALGTVMGFAFGVSTWLFRILVLTRRE